MERILNDNEKIRRAEEIYYRRNHARASLYQERELRRPKTYLGSKILLEMLILLILATTVFAVKNKDYIFTQEFLNSVAQYNVNLTDKFDWLYGYFKSDNESEDVFVNNEIIENAVQEEKVQQEDSEVENQETENSDEQQEVVEVQGEETQSNSAEMLVTDEVSLKEQYNFTKPIEGIITSRFGSRNSEYKNVTANHTGLDIAADSGTEIKSAISGIVVQVSEEGDYGNHIKVENGNVDVLYAHCKDMYVTEGEQVEEGQIIATVGSTGNSTGPHLHFEIRIDNNPINPADIIEF